MSYGVYAENESGFVQIDGEYDNLAVLDRKLAWSTYQLNYPGTGWQFGTQYAIFPPDTAQVPDDVVRTTAPFSPVPLTYPSYDSSDFGWNRLPDNTPDDYSIFVKPFYETNWPGKNGANASSANATKPAVSVLASSNDNGRDTGVAVQITHEEKTVGGIKYVKFYCPYEQFDAAYPNTPFFWDSKVVEYAICIKHSDWIAINGEPTAVKNVQQVGSISAFHFWGTWFGGLAGIINQPLLTPEVAVGPQISLPSGLNFNPASPQVTPAVKYTVGLQFDPETKVLSFEWHDVQEGINPFEYFKITGDLSVGLSEEETTFDKSSATKYTETRNIYGSLREHFGVTTVVHKWEWITTDAFRSRLQAVNYIQYNIELFADAQYFGLDVRKQDGSLCYSSETPQMRVRATSSVDISIGLNYTLGSSNKYLNIYEPDATGVYALLKPFKKALQQIIFAPFGSNLPSALEYYFVTFDYNHSTFTSLIYDGPVVVISAANANKAQYGTSCNISVGVRTKNYQMASRSYASYGLTYFQGGQKTMITGTIV